MPTKDLPTEYLAKIPQMIKVEGMCPCCDEPVEAEVPKLALDVTLGHADCGETKRQVLVWDEVSVMEVEDVEKEAGTKLERSP